MSMQDLYEKIFKRQWPWWTAGFLTGLAEIINFVYKYSHTHEYGKFIGVTSGMARMLAGVEKVLTGASLIGTKADYYPDIQWIILGAILFGLVFAWLEGDIRSWVVYPKRFYIFVALGAFLFAWGTRVAGGCTLHHLLGGWVAFNLKSIVVMIVATIGAVIGILIMSYFNVTPFFKSQDTEWYVKKAKEMGWADGLTYDEAYNPMKDWIRLALYAFWIVFIVVILYLAIGGTGALPEGFYYKAFPKHVLTAENLPSIIVLLIIGGLLGLAVAKTGFGTECAIMTPEMGTLFNKYELKLGKRFKFTYSIRTIFMSMGPITAYALHVVLAGFVFWLFFLMTGSGAFEGHHVPWHASMRNWPNLYLDLFGGFLLGLGTVFMLGCEFRNYGRTGLLYITGLLIWPFFYLGYLPYTLARDFWDSIMTDPNLRYANTTFVPELVAPGNFVAQAIIYLLWILFWLAVFILSLKIGAKHLGVTIKDLLTKNSEELYLLRLEKLKKENPEYFEKLDQLEKELYDVGEKVLKARI